MLGEESFSEASGESTLRLSHSEFSSRDLGSISTDEVVHGLVIAQLGHWGQYSVGVTSQINNVFRMTSNSRDFDIVYVLQRVAYSSVFSQRSVVEVYGSGLIVVILNVLYH